MVLPKRRGLTFLSSAENLKRGSFQAGVAGERELESMKTSSTEDLAFSHQGFPGSFPFLFFVLLSHLSLLHQVISSLLELRWHSNPPFLQFAFEISEKNWLHIQY